MEKRTWRQLMTFLMTEVHDSWLDSPISVSVWETTKPAFQKEKAVINFNTDHTAESKIILETPFPGIID
jgi:hypothetical protein